MPMFDYFCQKCRRWEEQLIEPGKVVHYYACPCGGSFVKTWRKAPGIAPDITPGFSVQLGCYVKNRQHKESILKERGLVELGVDECRWTESQPSDPEEPMVDHDRLHDAMAKAANDIKYQNIPLEPAPVRDPAEVGTLLTGE